MTGLYQTLIVVPEREAQSRQILQKTTRVMVLTVAPDSRLEN